MFVQMVGIDGKGIYMFLNEMKERSKQGQTNKQTNKQTRQSNTAHPRQSLFPKKNELLVEGDTCT